MNPLNTPIYLSYPTCETLFYYPEGNIIVSAFCDETGYFWLDYELFSVKFKKRDLFEKAISKFTFIDILD